MTKIKQAICIIALLFLIPATVAPASADKIITTETKVFFEKDGQPYNEPVKFMVKCYGYVIDSTDPYYSNYWRGTYQKKEAGTYNTTEVFSYSATASGYGAKIYEPYYFKYLAFDYCTLEGETNGKKFIIENSGDSPDQNCSWRQHSIDYNRLKKNSDICYLSTNESINCYKEESESNSEKYYFCDQYLEEYDKNKTYPQEDYGMHIDNIQMMKTDEYKKCRDEIKKINFNCSRYEKEVSCKDYCDPDGNPVQRDCSLYFTIPTDENGNIIETAEDENNFKSVFTSDQGLERSESLFTAILKFLGLY
ncbi:MAG: hypothetical protein PHV39_05140 [Methanomicrobium sp.]|nr:hypothetical protein [Methanomicrobium sp.]